MVFKYIKYLTLVLIVLINACAEKQPETIESAKEEVKPVVYEYGFPTDSLIEKSDVVSKNETLADILTVVNVPYIKIAEIAQKSKEIFDVRKIRPGKKYSIFTEDDSVKTAKYFVYEKTPIDYIVYDLADSIKITEGQKEVKKREKILTGVINSSLYETLSEIEASPKLAILLADVFAWQIDFYTIQKGDNFKVIFEEQFVDNDFVGVGKILAANFNHRGKDYYAFEYIQNDKVDFFDENGNSLQKAFLKAPLKFTRISSRFTRSRLHPILRIYRPHLGIDYAAPTGTPVVAIGDGVVTDKRWTKGGGRYVKIKHNSTYESGYMHLSKYGKGIAPGAQVRQGQVIGYVGSSGLATGPHLDFRFWKNGQLINYLNVEFPPSHPIDNQVRENFIIVMHNFKRKLDLTPLPGSQIASNSKK